MFTVALFTITRRWGKPQCPSNGGMNKPTVIYPYNGILFSNKRNVPIYTTTKIDHKSIMIN